MTIVINKEEIEVIDAHGHIGIQPDLRQSGFPPVERYLGNECIRDMNEVGVDKAIIFPMTNPSGDYSKDNNMVAKEVKKYPDRLLGFCRVSPRSGPETCIEEIRRSVKGLGLKGLKLNPSFDWHYPNSESVHQIMEEVRKLKIPIIYHSGITLNASPALIGALAMDFPDVKIIMAHIGIFEWAEDAIAIAERVSNLYLDTSNVASVAFIRKAVRRLGVSKVLFGTDRPFSPTEFELSKIVKYLELTTDEMRSILSKNVKRILGLR